MNLYVIIRVCDINGLLTEEILGYAKSSTEANTYVEMYSNNTSDEGELIFRPIYPIDMSVNPF